MILNAKTNVEAMRELATKLEQEIATLAAKADETVGTPKEVADYPKLSDVEVTHYLNLGNTSSFFETRGFYNGWNKITTSKELDERLVLLEAAYDKYGEMCNAVDEKNVEPIAYNKALVAKITSVMEHIGVRATYSSYELPTPRSQNRKYVTKTAGYIGDLARTIKTGAGLKPNIEQYKRQVKETHQRLVQEIYRKEREAEAATKKKEDEQKIVFYRVKYTPTNPCSLPEDVLDAILDKCKYLKLAHFLQKNRGGWSDGYSYAEYGISSFVVETEEDKEIEEDIQSCIDSGNESGDYDGRIFRDTTYNYSVLFGMVDKELLADYHAVSEMNEDY